MGRKRRKFKPEFKLDTVIEGLRGEKPIAQICRERDITESLYYSWRDIFKDRAVQVFEDQRISSQPNNEEEQIATLERKIGQLTMEVEVLKKAKSWLDTQRGKSER